LHHFKVGVFLATTILPTNGVFDNHKLAGQVDANGEGRSAAYNVDLPFQEALLDDVSVRGTETGMVECNSRRNQC
jgi:hypothetical protein